MRRSSTDLGSRLRGNDGLSKVYVIPAAAGTLQNDTHKLGFGMESSWSSIHPETPALPVILRKKRIDNYS